MSLLTTELIFLILTLKVNKYLNFLSTKEHSVSFFTKNAHFMLTKENPQIILDQNKFFNQIQ